MYPVIGCAEKVFFNLLHRHTGIGFFSKDHWFWIVLVRNKVIESRRHLWLAKGFGEELNRVRSFMWALKARSRVAVDKVRILAVNSANAHTVTIWSYNRRLRIVSSQTIHILWCLRYNITGLVKYLSWECAFRGIFQLQLQSIFLDFVRVNVWICANEPRLLVAIFNHFFFLWFRYQSVISFRFQQFVNEQLNTLILDRFLTAQAAKRCRALLVDFQILPGGRSLPWECISMLTIGWRSNRVRRFSGNRWVLQLKIHTMPELAVDRLLLFFFFLSENELLVTLGSGALSLITLVSHIDLLTFFVTSAFAQNLACLSNDVFKFTHLLRVW